VFHGEPEGENATIPDMTWRERGIMLPLLVLIVFLGVYPKPVLDRIQPSVDRLIAHVEQHSDFTEPRVAKVGAGAVAGGTAGADDHSETEDGHED
jgi:NADH-quinone oxidoreductase subunit M